MMRFARCRALFCTIAFFPVIFATSACHSYHIDSTIENRTGADVQLLEVDYPSASFGVDTLPTGAVFHYRFQVRGSGLIKVEYTAPNGHQVQATGPNVVEHQQGRFEIVLLPDGKCQFLPYLTPDS